MCVFNFEIFQKFWFFYNFSGYVRIRNFTTLVPALTDYIAANCNYTWHDTDGPRELENIKALYTFTENRGYEWAWVRTKPNF